MGKTRPAAITQEKGGPRTVPRAKSPQNCFRRRAATPTGRTSRYLELGTCSLRRNCHAVQSKPSLLAWITCDGVHIDPASGKHTILGVFSNIKARSFPVMHPYMVWFLTLTDVQPGTHKIRMSMGLNPSNTTELLHREFESQSPLHRINLINELRNLRFETPGDYSIVIEVDDDPILATSLTVS